MGDIISTREDNWNRQARQGTSVYLAAAILDFFENFSPSY
jgi:hypothetical protein